VAFSPTPNQTDFLAFIRGTAIIDPLVLPDNSTVITDAFAYAQAVVNPLLANLSGTLFALATYNLGTDYIINYAPDQVVNGVSRTDFADMRAKYGINTFVPGVTSSSANAPTSQALLNPEFMKKLTFGDLQLLKTPYGRFYMNVAQRMGTIWGVS
jgi:hypothetical protein